MVSTGPNGDEFRGKRHTWSLDDVHGVVLVSGVRRGCDVVELGLWDHVGCCIPGADSCKWDPFGVGVVCGVHWFIGGRDSECRVHAVLRQHCSSELRYSGYFGVVQSAVADNVSGVSGWEFVGYGHDPVQ